MDGQAALLTIRPYLPTRARSKRFQRMQGHASDVKGVAFFNDGCRIVTGSRDGTLRLWDVQKGTLVGEPFEGHQESILSVAVSPDDKRIASGGEDNTIIIWDVESRQVLLGPLVKHTNMVYSVCFSPADGTRLASGSYDCTVIVWDAGTGAVLATLEDHRGLVLSVAFSPDGLKLASGSWETIRVWRTHSSNAELLLEINSHQDFVRSVVWSPDGQQLVSASYDKTVKFWDASTGHPIGQPCIGHTNCIRSLAISFDGSFIATASDKTVRLWSTTTRQQIRQSLEHSQSVYCIAISPNGELLASGHGGLDSMISLYSIEDTLKQQDGWGKEGLDIGQRLHIIDTLPTPPAESLIYNDTQVTLSDTRAGPSSSSTHTSYYSETEDPKNRAGDDDEDSLFDFSSFTETSKTPVPSSVTKRKRDDENDENLDLLIRRRHAQQMSFIQAASDSDLSVAPEVVLQDLMKHITKIGNYAVARGGFGEIWKCIYQTDRGPINVAVKSLLVYASDEVTEAMEKKTKRILRELKICMRLKHQNIMPVHGYTSGFGPFMAIVSPWAENGNLSTYLERDDTSLTVVRRFQILRDIAAGLQYLHANRVIHGDLTGPNVLIHGDGTACLADFGLSLLYSEVVSISQASWTSAFHGNARWMAPELFRESEDDQPIRPSKYSDIYSFGGIMLQVLTSKIPYYYLREAAVSGSIYNGVKPSRSRYPAVPDTYWHFIEECWSITPQDRPSAERAVEVISDELDSLSGASADS